MLHGNCISGISDCLVGVVFSSSSFVSPGVDFKRVHRRSVEELWTGVEVRQASCIDRIRPLRLFGVLAIVLAVDWLRVGISLRAHDASVAKDEAISEVFFSASIFLGCLFLDFGDPPTMKPVVEGMMFPQKRPNVRDSALPRDRY